VLKEVFGPKRDEVTRDKYCVGKHQEVRARMGRGKVRRVFC
jgi:hypothetical protein